MTIVCKSGTYLQFLKFEIKSPNLSQNISSLIGRKWRERLISVDHLGINVWGYMSKYISECFNFSRPEFKYVNQCQNHSSENWNKSKIIKFLECAGKTIIPTQPNRKLCQICKWFMYEILLSLLWETVTYFIFIVKIRLKIRTKNRN